MAITFPTSPSLNDTHTAGDIIWTWNGSSWESTVVGTGMDNVVEDTTPQLGGDLDTNSNKITFADSVNAEFGNDGDLKIFHNGGHSIVRETGTGDLYLQSDNNVILSTDSSTKKMVKGIANGATELYHNDVLKLNTSTSGVTIVDEVHTEGATPHLTLKRTDNANVPTVRFKGSGGTVGASIEFDGTSGTANELAFQTYDGVSLAERLRVGHTATTVAGNLVVSGDFTVNGTTTTVNTTEMTVSDNIITLNNDVTGAPSENAGIEVERGSSSNVSIRWNETSDQWEFTNDGASYTALGGGGGGSSNAISQGNTNVTVTDTGSDGTIIFDTEGTDRWAFTSAGHLLPYTNATYDIGSAEQKVRHLFLSDNSLKFVDASDVVYTLSVNSGQLEFEGSPIGGGIANVVEDTTPQLGGDLVTGTNRLKFSSSGGSMLDFTVTQYSVANNTVLSSVGSINLFLDSASADASGDTAFRIFDTTDPDGTVTEANNIFKLTDTGDIEVKGLASLYKGAEEKYSALTGATGTVAHDCANGKMFYHTSPAADWTANFTNLNLNQNKFSTSIGIVVTQGNTAYIPNAVQIGGVAQTIIWQGNSTPTGTDNGTDAISFTIMNDGGTYIVLGQLTSFGGV